MACFWIDKVMVREDCEGGFPAPAWRVLHSLLAAPYPAVLDTYDSSPLANALSDGSGIRSTAPIDIYLYTPPSGSAHARPSLYFSVRDMDLSAFAAPSDGALHFRLVGTITTSVPSDSFQFGLRPDDFGSVQTKAGDTWTVEHLGTVWVPNQDAMGAVDFSMGLSQYAANIGFAFQFDLRLEAYF
ncbi:MAG: hypothetical protein LBL59_08695 [Xanthomonadaceae bacterium]|jgi:hypothetical protein|nr:hypothetical protein [Xanthomonadaceae bacterium]